MKCKRCKGSVLHDGIELVCINCGSRPFGYNGEWSHNRFGEQTPHVELPYVGDGQETTMPAMTEGYSTGGADLMWQTAHGRNYLFGEKLQARQGFVLGAEGFESRKEQTK